MLASISPCSCVPSITPHGYERAARSVVRRVEDACGGASGACTLRPTRRSARVFVHGPQLTRSLRLVLDIVGGEQARGTCALVCAKPPVVTCKLDI